MLIGGTTSLPQDKQAHDSLLASAETVASLRSQSPLKMSFIINERKRFSFAIIFGSSRLETAARTCTLITHFTVIDASKTSAF